MAWLSVQWRRKRDWSESGVNLRLVWQRECHLEFGPRLSIHLGMYVFNSGFYHVKSKQGTFYNRKCDSLVRN